MVDLDRVINGLARSGLASGLAGGLAGGALTGALTSKRGRNVDVAQHQCCIPCASRGRLSRKCTVGIDTNGQLPVTACVGPNHQVTTGPAFLYHLELVAILIKDGVVDVVSTLVGVARE